LIALEILNTKRKVVYSAIKRILNNNSLALKLTKKLKNTSKITLMFNLKEAKDQILLPSLSEKEMMLKLKSKIRNSIDSMLL